MGEKSSAKTTPPRAAALDELRDDPDGEYRPASRSEAVRALDEERRVYARESFDGNWVRVARIEDLLEHGRRTPACTVHFTSGHVRTALDDDFLVER